MYDCRYWLWLSLKFEPGSVKCDALLHALGDNPKTVYEADRDTLAPYCGGNLRLLNALCDKSLGQVYSILDYCERNNVGLLTKDDPKYPSPLLGIQGQPPVIYYKGVIPDFGKRLAIAVVGTRSVTPYGLNTAYTISHDIASAGAIVVSGMALGTDTAAHRGALDAQGVTVAFLGCGIDRVYPKENTALMREIIAHGAVMTDYPPGASPEGKHFPIRNRLISGVCNGVLVVEAARKSGALRTAEHASKQGKLLYAIPGRIGELESEGTNQLLSNGAKTVTCAADILRDYRSLFDITEKQTFSGHTVFKGSAPTRELPRTYQTPVYNPAPIKQEPAPVISMPKPSEQAPSRVSDEEERAMAYMSMDTEEPSYANVPLLLSKKVKYEQTSPEGDRPDQILGVVETADQSAKRLEHTQRFKELYSTSLTNNISEKPDRTGLSEQETAVIEALEKNERLSADALSQLGIPPGKIISVLTMLEIKQLITHTEGGFYELNK